MLWESSLELENKNFTSVRVPIYSRSDNGTLIVILKTYTPECISHMNA